MAHKEIKKHYLKERDRFDIPDDRDKSQISIINGIDVQKMTIPTHKPKI